MTSANTLCFYSGHLEADVAKHLTDSFYIFALVRWEEWVWG